MLMTVFYFYQLVAQILYFNTFFTFLYMFRALLRLSSGGKKGKVKTVPLQVWSGPEGS
jgi:hypothetical protein